MNTLKKQFRTTVTLWQIFLSFIIIISLNTCDLISGDSGNKCKETEQPSIEKSFVPAIYVKHNNGTSYVGANVEINIYKEYCDGTIKGTFVKKTTITENDYGGYANFAYVFTYKFENLEDKINYTITVTGVDLKTGETKEFKYLDSMGYKEVSESEGNQILLLHNLTVPW